MKNYIIIGNGDENTYSFSKRVTARGHKYSLYRVARLIDDTFYENEIKRILNSSGNSTIYIDDALINLVSELGFEILKQ